jgi:hypothetical protein
VSGTRSGSGADKGDGVIAIFVDGPLIGEVKDIPHMPTFEVLLPPRVTICTCDEWDEISPIQSETVTYHIIMRGDNVAMMAIDKTPEGVLSSMKYWVRSNFSAEIWQRNCRDERAFT